MSAQTKFHFHLSEGTEEAAVSLVLPFHAGADFCLTILIYIGLWSIIISPHSWKPSGGTYSAYSWCWKADELKCKTCDLQRIACMQHLTSDFNYPQNCFCDSKNTCIQTSLTLLSAQSLSRLSILIRSKITFCWCLFLFGPWREN